jgi:protein kinase
METMERYDVKEKIGEGTFGTVYCASKKSTGDKVRALFWKVADLSVDQILFLKLVSLSVQVAIKRIKQSFQEWNEAARVREFKAMLAMSHECKHIVPIYELIREEDNSLYFVFEYMPDGTLNDFLSRTAQQGGVVEPSTIRSIIFQVLQGLEHIHSRGYMHRDLKPENLLMRGMDCKVADFSLARGAVSAHGMTTYVSTRWYRAPEIILCAPKYSTPVDMFAVGCIVAELYRLFPLFPGSGEVDQLQRVLKLLGNLEDAEWPEGVHLSRRFGLGAPTRHASTPLHILQEAIPLAETTAISFIHNLLQLNPARRLTAKAALQHKYFGEEAVNEPRRQQSPTATPPEKTNVDIGHNRTPGLVSISPGFRDNLGCEIGNMIPSQEVYHNGAMNPRDTMGVGHGSSMCIVAQDPCCLQSPVPVDHDLRHFMNHMKMPRSLDNHLSYENDRIQSHEMYGIHGNLNSVSPNESRLGRKIRRVACTPAQAFNVD